MQGKTEIPGLYSTFTHHLCQRKWNPRMIDLKSSTLMRLGMCDKNPWNSGGSSSALCFHTVRGGWVKTRVLRGKEMIDTALTSYFHQGSLFRYSTWKPYARSFPRLHFQGLGSGLLWVAGIKIGVRSKKVSIESRSSLANMTATNHTCLFNFFFQF